MRIRRRGTRARVSLLLGSVALVSGLMMSMGGLVAPANAQSTSCNLYAGHTTMRTGFVGYPYSDQVDAEGGTPPYTYEMTDVGSLPPGLSMDSSGLVSGTPEATGSYEFAVNFYDSGDPQQCGGARFHIGVISGTPPVVCSDQVSNPVLPQGAVGTAYSEQLQGQGGTPPYSFTLASGSSLPTGLSMDPSGLISGTPLVPGQYSFNVDITDSADPSGCGTSGISMGVTSNNPTLDGLTSTVVGLTSTVQGLLPTVQRIVNGLPSCLLTQLNTLLNGTPPNPGCQPI